MMKENFLIIDGSSLVHRAFYALPPLATKSGFYTNAIYGFLGMLYSIKENYQPDYIFVAFDRSGPTFRHEIYKDYKGHRDKTPSELSQQFPVIKDILKAMSISVLDSDEYEADDIAGTLSYKAKKQNLNTVLVTGDRDYLQLVNENTKVLLTKKGISKVDEYTEEKIKEEYGIMPKQLIELKGLMGDQSDNIPGVPGIGKKRGLDLIKKYDNIENIYKNIEEITAKKMKENLVKNKELAFMSRDLGKIVLDIPLELDIEELRLKEPDWEQLLSIYEKYELKKYIEKIPEEYKKNISEDINVSYKIIENNFDDIKKRIVKEKKVAFKILKDAGGILGNPLYLGFKVDNEPSYLINIEDENILKEFKDIFEDENIEKIGHELKEDFLVLFRNDIKIKNYTFDSMIGKYILDPSQKDYSINSISDEYFHYYGKDLEEILGKGKKQKSFFDADKIDLYEYLAFTLEVISKVQKMILDEICKLGMLELYNSIELPIIEVLASMEYYGFEIDKDEFKKLKLEYDKELNDLTSKIYEMAGIKFNINSPKQVGEVLFEKLKLPVIKRTKTGYSTSVDVLEKLKSKHPIITQILRYREISKLKSTYIDGFIKLINPNTNRIHSSFNQTITTTGRISSTEPNLQNIPIRTEDGRKIRKAFISKKPEYVLLDADYSQIELRVLAHISKDKNMIDAFNKNLDIHKKTASQVFHVPIENVTQKLRNNAKAVNFGIVYGISDYGLATDLEISRKEAGEYIDKYLDNYFGVKEFMDNIIKKGKEQGYVETIFNRRRYIPELKSKNFNVKSFGERIALNTPIQGSAADIIKIAMINVYKELKNKNLKSRLILQVHDELIIETYKEELKEVKKLLKKEMENAIELSVPLIVDIETGENWYETNE